MSFNSGDNWHRVGAEASSNCDDAFFNVDCSLGDDMGELVIKSAETCILEGMHSNIVY